MFDQIWRSTQSDPNDLLEGQTYEQTIQDWTILITILTHKYIPNGIQCFSMVLANQKEIQPNWCKPT